jgi:hypothetical protein
LRQYQANRKEPSKKTSQEERKTKNEQFTTFICSYISINVKKTYQFTVSVKGDNYDACNTANIKISGRQNLAKWALTYYGGFTHERLLSESSRPYMLAYYLSALIDCAYFFFSCLEEKT